MKHERATEEVRELAALYALGALTQHEADSFQTHLREGCAVCAAELHRFERAAACIGLAMEEADTPDYLRDLLIARTERESAHAAAAPPVEKTSGMETASSSLPRQTPPTLSAQPKSKGSSLPAWTLAVIFALLAIVAFYFWKSAQATASRLQTGLDAAQMETGKLQRQIEALQKTESKGPETMTELAGRPGIRISRLKGQPATPGNSAVLFWDTRRHQCFVAGTFAPLPKGKAYQLWLSTPTARVGLGLLPSDANGHIAATLPTPGDAAGATGVIVSIEPEQGSASLTGPFCATGRID